MKVIAEVRNASYDNLSHFDAIFVPNNDYLKNFDSTVMDVSAGMYNEDGFCIWNNQLMLPIYDVHDDVRGFAAFDPFVYADVHSNAGGGNYYTYSSSSVMSKKRFMLGTKGIFKKAYEDGYLCITDGVFDTISLDSIGVNSAALMGSSLTPEILFQLRFIKNVILVQDNDDAGLQLANKLLKVHHGATVFKQRYSKDFDGALNSDNRDEVISELKTFLLKKQIIRS